MFLNLSTRKLWTNLVRTEFDHKRDRHVAGLKLSSAVFVVTNTIGIINFFFFQTFNLPESNQIVLANLTIGMLIAGSIFYFVNSGNYRFLLAVSVLKVILSFIIFRQIIPYDFVNSIENPEAWIGRSMDFQFLVPLSFLLFSLTYLRFSVVLFLSIFITVYFFGYELYGYFQMFPNAYLSTDMGKVFSDNNAIYRVFFIANVGNFIIYVITVLFVSFLIERLTGNIARIEKSNAQLGRYFSPQIKEEIEAAEIEVIGKNPKGLDVAILFTDIVNFTKLSEKMDPKDVLSLLSDYQSIMIDSIFAHKGTVDKFVGDAVMANFGTPKSVGNDAQNAFDCALTMNKKLKEWNKTRELNGLQKISHRIGIHFGSCVVGNIGNELRTEFAVIGDPVNVASRICDSCKELGTNFVISQDLANRIVLTGKYEKVKNFRVRGREESIDLIKFYS